MFFWGAKCKGERDILVQGCDDMNISYRDYSDKNDHGYQYYQNWRRSKSTHT